MTTFTAKDAARILLRTKSILFNAREPFTYTSGKQGPVYVDCRRLISFPDDRTQLMDAAAAMIRKNCGVVDYVAGGETAGIPYAAFIAERLNLPMLYVRKKPKGFGRMAQIEGQLEDNKNVVLIEDLQTDGGSKKVFIDALRAAGANVGHAFVIFHYGIFAASQSNMKEWGLSLHALCEWKDVIAVAEEEKLLDAATLSSVKSYLANPGAWTAAA